MKRESVRRQAETPARYRRLSRRADLVLGGLCGILLLWVLALLFAAWQAILMSDRYWPALPILAFIPLVSLPYGRLIQGLWLRRPIPSAVSVVIGLAHLLPAVLQLAGVIEPSIDPLVAGLPGLVFLAAPGILGYSAPVSDSAELQAGR